MKNAENLDAKELLEVPLKHKEIKKPSFNTNQKALFIMKFDSKIDLKTAFLILSNNNQFDFLNNFLREGLDIHAHKFLLHHQDALYQKLKRY